MPTVEEFCEEITILSRGKVVLKGNLKDIKKSYGRVNLLVKTEEDMDDIIEELGMKVIDKTPNGYQMKITDKEQADKLLVTLIEKNMTIIRFELREPSLHEIFVEHVKEDTVGGNDADEQ